MQFLTASDEALLKEAFGADFGKLGHSLAGHEVVGADDVVSAIEQGQGSSLLYGELLPAGVAKLAAALFAGRESAGMILELGMGTGKVALQLFLTLHRDVYGVELAPSRFALADEALQKLAAADAERFHYEGHGPTRGCLRDSSFNISCEFVCGSLLDTPVEQLSSASAVVMEVCLPHEVKCLAAEILQKCRTGVRVVCYAPLHGLVSDCRLAPVGHLGLPKDEAIDLGDGQGALLLPASWKEVGHGFAFYQLADSAADASAAWQAACKVGLETVQVDTSGCPSRARRLKHTDDVLGSPRSDYPWSKGDKVMVGYSWLPFLDLGEPDDDDPAGLDGVTWMAARIYAIAPSGYATICYEDDGTIEEGVHPERIRKPGCRVARPRVEITSDDEGNS